MKKQYAALVGASLLLLSDFQEAHAAPLPSTPVNAPSFSSYDENAIATTVPLLQKTRLEVTASSANHLGKEASSQTSSYASHLGYTVGGLTLKIGYQSLISAFSLSRDPEHLGMQPAQLRLQGKTFSGSYALSHSLTLNGGIESYRAVIGDARFNTNIGLQSGDRFSHFQLGVGYGLSSSDAVNLGFEHVIYTLQGNAASGVRAGQPIENTINLGVGHTFNPNASVKFLYRIVRYDDKGTGFAPSANGGKMDNGVAVGQFSLKF